MHTTLSVAFTLIENMYVVRCVVDKNLDRFQKLVTRVDYTK